MWQVYAEVRSERRQRAESSRERMRRQVCGSTCSFLFSALPSVHPILQLVQTTRTFLFFPPATPCGLFYFARPLHPENRQNVDDKTLEHHNRASVRSWGYHPPGATSPWTTYAPYLRTRSTSCFRPLAVQFHILLATYFTQTNTRQR